MSAPFRQHLGSQDTIGTARRIEIPELKEIQVLHRTGHSDYKISVLVFLISTSYATIRYNLLKGVAWTDWPLFTLNKVLGVSSLLILLITIIRYNWKPALSNGKLLYMAALFGGMHVLISCMLLNPTYYEKFFQTGKLTSMASLSMLAGVIAAVLFISGAASKGDRKVRSKINSLAFISFLVALHTGLQGFQLWLTPSAWPGFIPPITLLAFLAGTTALVISFFQKHTH